nr:AAA family ATPase [[Pseudomonas] hibiscicola]
MAGIVGRNDYGKWTILEAQAILFETGDLKADESDTNYFSLAGGAEQFDIACEFDDLPEALVLDENAQTSLAQEYLLNAEGALEIVKSFKANTGNLELISVRCQHPTDKVLNGLLSLKMDDLGRLGEQRGIVGHVADGQVASQWRQAIRDVTLPVVCQETLLDVGKRLSSDNKSIWEKFEALLLTFALFKADRESSDGDAEAKNRWGADTLGYFRVSLSAAKAIADASDGPDLLAVYIVLARFAFGDRRDLVARQHPQLLTLLVQAGLYP